MRNALFALLIIVLAACSGGEHDYSETDIATLHDQMQRGELSSEVLVRWYIDRIETIDRTGPATEFHD